MQFNDQYKFYLQTFEFHTKEAVRMIKLMASLHSFIPILASSLIVFCVLHAQADNTHPNWIDAHATFYGDTQNPTTLGGACGYENTYQAGFGANTAAVSEALFRGGEACGACYEVMCNHDKDPRWCLGGRESVIITTTNLCPSNNHGGWCDPPRHHFDLTEEAFFGIARSGNEGVVPVLYKRVACKRSGGVRFSVKGKSNFNMITFSNVGGSGDVKNALIRGSPASASASASASAWQPMTRSWGAVWQSRIDLRSQTLSFKLTLVDGKTLDFFDVVPSSWQFGQTFSSPNQF